jgi:hypothetical protein
MTRLEKAETLKKKGYTYNSKTGKIFGVRGNEIINLRNDGYIQLTFKIDKNYVLLGHHFAYYMTYGNVDFIELDHENRIKSDNRISNLRISNRKQQTQNRNSKGYYYDKINNKYLSRINYLGKDIFLGRYNTEEEAREAYIKAKQIYH